MAGRSSSLTCTFQSSSQQKAVPMNFPAAALRIQSGSKLELRHRNAMLERASHKQKRISLQYFAQYTPEQQILLMAIGNIESSSWTLQLTCASKTLSSFSSSSNQ